MIVDLIGKCLDWAAIKSCSSFSKNLAAQQALNVYLREKHRQDPVFQWGDEIEYMLVRFDDKLQTAKLKLNSPDVLRKLRQQEQDNAGNDSAQWASEYTCYVVEGIPRHPYGSDIKDYESVEENMKQRRLQVLQVLEENETLLSLTSFPRLGCVDFSVPYDIPTAEKTRKTGSMFLPDSVLFPESSIYVISTENLSTKRGEQPSVNLPIFQDRDTRKRDASLDHFVQKPKTGVLDHHIYMDAKAFGMGCCCLQVTLKGNNLTEARILHDQMAVICPLMLAMTAAAPLHRGMIADVDCRWGVISATNDCRNREERGLEQLKTSKQIIHKARYDSISCYISEEGQRYNDAPVSLDSDCFELLSQAGMDPSMSRYFANLLMLEPLYIDEDTLKGKPTDFSHLQTYYATNWTSIRFKLPFKSDDPGWRIEFRPCDLQLTDRENAAVACFIALLSRAVIHLKLDFLIPISKVDENFVRAQKRDAVRTQKFWFRAGKDGSVVETTMDEVFNGKEGVFLGLVPAVRSYMEEMQLKSKMIEQYLVLLSKRASGELLTDAQWIRKFVTSHPDYKFDSVVSDSMNYDLLKTIDRIQKNDLTCPEILGSY